LQSELLKERDHLGDIDVDGRIIFKWIIGGVVNTEYRNMLQRRDKQDLELAKYKFVR
jgi:hypothetical protein